MCSGVGPCQSVSLSTFCFRIIEKNVSGLNGATVINIESIIIEYGKVKLCFLIIEKNVPGLNGATLINIESNIIEYGKFKKA